VFAFERGRVLWLADLGVASEHITDTSLEFRPAAASRRARGRQAPPWRRGLSELNVRATASVGLAIGPNASWTTAGSGWDHARHRSVRHSHRAAVKVRDSILIRCARCSHRSLLLATVTAHAGGTGTITGRSPSLARQASRPAYSGLRRRFNESATEPAIEVEQKGKKFIPDLIGLTADNRCRSERRSVPAQRIFADGDAPLRPGQLRAGAESIAQIPRSPAWSTSTGNIHPEMSATIVVLPNRRHVIAKPDGSFSIEGIPQGK